MTRRTHAGALVLALIVFTAPAATTLAQEPAPTRQPPAGRGGMAPMMAGRQMMQAQMQAQAKKLDALVAAMNAAVGGEKIDRIATVVNELVAQHKAMHARMMAMPMMAAPAGDAAKPATPATPPTGAGDDHAGHHPPER